MNSQTRRLAGMALLIAIVVVLQMLGSFIKFGPFSITLVLVPIVIGAAIYGRNAGAVLGGAFGAVVLINTINGLDPGAYLMWLANPALTAALCLLKGILAGYAAGAVYEVLSKKNINKGVIFAAVACPTVNTGIFIAALVLFFRDILIMFAGETGVIYFLLVTITGINYVPELVVNIVLAPAILRVIKAVRISPEA